MARTTTVGAAGKAPQRSAAEKAGNSTLAFILRKKADRTKDQRTAPHNPFSGVPKGRALQGPPMLGNHYRRRGANSPAAKVPPLAHDPEDARTPSAPHRRRWFHRDRVRR